MLLRVECSRRLLYQSTQPAVTHSMSSRPLSGRSLTVLRMLQERDSLGVTEISRTLDVSLSTAHRLLSSLVKNGYAAQDHRTRRYVLGQAINASLYHRMDDDLVDLSHKYLVRLEEATGETAHLVTVEGGYAQYPDAVESHQPIRVPGKVNYAVPAYASAGGKAILAFLKPVYVRQLFPGTTLPAATQTTIRTAHDLARELQGCALRAMPASQGNGCPRCIPSLCRSRRVQAGRLPHSLSLYLPSAQASELQSNRKGSSSSTCASRHNLSQRTSTDSRATEP